MTSRIARIVLKEKGLLQNSQTQETVTKPIKQDWKGAGGVEPGLRLGVMGLFLRKCLCYRASNEGEARGYDPNIILQNNLTFHEIFCCEC